ncbi:hypothetical protein B5807_10171 [Epicoccum nigrum]|uniref:BTB domain-containing protein n=1 Tax=Epicoccum nigrum TaxID=105696 RepID=A0A1Y2LNQ3_EPING|nr:hypothetical protein B5807_10171 [Epicoccum nigrum]
MATEASCTRTMTPSFLTMDLDTVTLKLGQAEIAVYKTLLTAVSDYFRKAFDGPFREADERSIALEGVSERTLRIFLQWAYVQNLQFNPFSGALKYDALLPPDEVERIHRKAPTSAEVTGTTEEAEDGSNYEPDDDTETSTKGGPLFDEAQYYTLPSGSELYWNHGKWTENAETFYLTLTELFVFADKYSVPQLRDNVVTAFVGQIWKWSFFPSFKNDHALICLMATKLPASSKLKEFIACCIAWVVLPDTDENPEDRMRSLQALDPDLAVTVGIAYAVTARDCTASKSFQMSVVLSDHLSNACVFHDHTHLDQDQCRKRIASRPHIFTAILDACAKAVMTKPTEEN